MNGSQKKSLLLGLAGVLLVLLIWAVLAAVDRRDEEAYFEMFHEHRDHAAAAVQEQNAKSDAARLAAIESLSETQLNCLGMYLKYGNVPISKLTMSQIRQIEDCQTRGLYHDLE
jgi:hypothetical protein